MLQDCEANTTGHNWLRSVKDILLKLGMNEFWISQEPGDVNIFLARVRQRLADQFFQTNDSTIETCSKCENIQVFRQNTRSS